jgi:hypothetical protein
MNLLAALVPLGLAMMTGGGTQKTSGEDGMGLAESFLVASGAIEGGKGMSSVQPFSTPEMAELTRGKPTTTAKMDPIQRIVQSDARVASAVSRMLTESSNQQMRDFSAKYATSATTPQGRKTLATKQPGDIKVT